MTPYEAWIYIQVKLVYINNESNIAREQYRQFCAAYFAAQPAGTAFTVPEHPSKDTLDRNNRLIACLQERLREVDALILERGGPPGILDKFNEQEAALEAAARFGPPPK